MTDATHPDGENEPIPFWQRFLDDVFLLLVLGLTIPVLSYLVWGLVELANVPVLR